MQIQSEWVPQSSEDPKRKGRPTDNLDSIWTEPPHLLKARKRKPFRSLWKWSGGQAWTLRTQFSDDRPQGRHGPESNRARGDSSMTSRRAIFPMQEGLHERAATTSFRSAKAPASRSFAPVDEYCVASLLRRQSANCRLGGGVSQSQGHRFSRERLSRNEK